MKLFGLIEAVHIYSIFFLPLTIPISHYKLFEKLEEYDSNLSVGLELESTKEILQFSESPSIKFQNQRIYLDLYKHFKSRSNKIYFLESEDYFRKVATFGEECVSLKKKIENAENLDKSLYLILDKLMIEFNYMSTIGREDYLLQNMVQYKPDLVFVGAGHASRFYKNKEKFLEKYGINIEEYWEDKIIKSITEDDLMLAAGACSKELPMEYYLESDTEVELRKIESLNQITEDFDGTYIERLYKAIKEGHVTNGKPHYVGTFDLEMKYEGLFEVYVNNIENFENSKNTKSIGGIIEDCFGTAKFRGLISKKGKEIFFVKNYIKAIERALKGDILYNGIKQENGEYKGTYSGMFREETISGNFEMRQVKSF